MRSRIAKCRVRASFDGVMYVIGKHLPKYYAVKMPAAAFEDYDRCILPNVSQYIVLRTILRVRNCSDCFANMKRFR